MQRNESTKSMTDRFRCLKNKRKRRKEEWTAKERVAEEGASDGKENGNAEKGKTQNK